jgi:hypothetical protein
MTEPSESFKLWHSERADSILKRAEELAAEYVKDGFNDSGATRRTALLEVFGAADGSGWDAWQAGRESALLDAMNATTPFGKTGAVIAAAIGALK